MNRIVREHYPVEKLPDDLRAAVEDESSVRVVLERETAAPPAGEMAREGHFSRWGHLRQTRFETPEGVVAHVRALRDEWDRR
ncbi:hypothetical protein DFO45_2066 [Azorhizobium sp. AG788]|uniref:hypothetical protein n=1 Tax=Azorhizobium sp. AG788 TaxID=2183897 RepID=UPI0010602A61|nr:hypothetical protein [Azorhizobium sp. AG788]TDT96863.1 hypothetical protein DFO45_2066 [Azorhizobium sp. AG788]